MWKDVPSVQQIGEKYPETLFWLGPPDRQSKHKERELGMAAESRSDCSATNIKRKHDFNPRLDQGEHHPEGAALGNLCKLFLL